MDHDFAKGLGQRLSGKDVEAAVAGGYLRGGQATSAPSIGPTLPGVAGRIENAIDKANALRQRLSATHIALVGGFGGFPSDLKPPSGAPVQDKEPPAISAMDERVRRLTELLDDILHVETSLTGRLA